MPRKVKGHPMTLQTYENRPLRLAELLRNFLKTTGYNPRKAQKLLDAGISPAKVRKPKKGSRRGA